MQFLGSFSQSMSQRYRSHANQPMGGVLISPLSRAKVVAESTDAKTSTGKCIPAEEINQLDVLNTIKDYVQKCEVSLLINTVSTLRHVSFPSSLMFYTLNLLSHMSRCDSAEGCTNNLSDDISRCAVFNCQRPSSVFKLPQRPCPHTEVALLTA